MDGDVAVAPALDCRPSGGGDRGVVLGDSLVTDSATLVHRGDRDPRPGGTLGLDRGAVTAVTPDPSLGDPTGDVVAGLIRGCEGTRRMVPPELLSITGAGTCSTFSFTIISPSMSSSSSSSSFFCSVTVSVGTTACFTIVPVKGTVSFIGLTMVPVNGLTMVPVKTSSVSSSSFFLISFCSSTTSLLGADAAAFVAGGAAGATVGSSAVTTRTSSILAFS